MAGILRVDQANVDYIYAKTAGSRTYMPGHVIQVQSTTKTDTFTSSTGLTWLDITGLSIAITPTSTSSKILVTAHVVGTLFRPTQNAVLLRLMRDSTAIGIGDTSGSMQRATMSSAKVSDDSVQVASMTFLDSPASTSALTYKVQIIQDTVANPFFINRTVNDSGNSYGGRHISTITVMEIAQ